MAVLKIEMDLKVITLNEKGEEVKVVDRTKKETLCGTVAEAIALQQSIAQAYIDMGNKKLAGEF